MKAMNLSALLVLLMVLSGGCSSVGPVHLDQSFWTLQQGKKVGVVLLPVPPAGATEGVTITRVVNANDPLGLQDGPWRDDAEYRPIRLAQMKPLQQAIVELETGDFTIAQDMFVEGFKRRGINAFKVTPNFSPRSLPEFKAGLVKNAYEQTDYRGFGRENGADFLLVLELVRYGPYCHYIYATNDYMEVQAFIRAELVDVRTNRVLWRIGGGNNLFRRQLDASCGNEDDIPVIATTLKSLLSDAVKAIYLDFFRS